MPSTIAPVHPALERVIPQAAAFYQRRASGRVESELQREHLALARLTAPEFTTRATRGVSRPPARLGTRNADIGPARDGNKRQQDDESKHPTEGHRRSGNECVSEQSTYDHSSISRIA
jgi:hypothetical protein